MIVQKSLVTNNPSLPSPIKSYRLFGRTIYVKHDDKIHPYFSGNKFRKLYGLYKEDSANIDTIISYGGAQSNAMLSIAALCHLKRWRFIYYTKPLNSRDSSGENFTSALKLGMEHHSLDDYRASIKALHNDAFLLPPTTRLLAQGGADSVAKEGIRLLADEISTQDFENLHVVLPSGTGTTALYLAKYLDAKLFTKACVGSEAYLKEQMRSLERVPKNLEILSTKRRYHFAKPHRELFDIYLTCKEAGLEIDLIYAAPTFKAIQESINSFKGDILYVHTGGLLGNVSMLKRYAHKGIA